MPNKLERVAAANAVLKTIAAHGRRFFYNAKTGETARFEVDARGAVWLIDDYQGARIYVAYPGRWRDFSHGGTMRDLVRCLWRYIRSGQPVPAKHFGPWPDWICEGDLWGYGLEAMTKVREGVQATGAVARA